VRQKIHKKVRATTWPKERSAVWFLNAICYFSEERSEERTATEYIGSNGKFIVVDNASKQVVQVSGDDFRPNHLVR
jgi:hypothetical protein